MDESQRRKYERKDSLNLIDYVLLGPEGNPISRRMGRTLNVSVGGILLETHHPLKQGQRVVITIALNEDIVEINGRVVYIKPCEDKLFCSGIEFAEIDEEGERVVKNYIEALKAEE
jgi:c-di-GMP-binding flagellar brake protein YcgR